MKRRNFLGTCSALLALPALPVLPTLAKPPLGVNYTIGNWHQIIWGPPGSGWMFDPPGSGVDYITGRKLKSNNESREVVVCNSRGHTFLAKWKTRRNEKDGYYRGYWVKSSDNSVQIPKLGKEYLKEAVTFWAEVGDYAPVSYLNSQDHERALYMSIRHALFAYSDTFQKGGLDITYFWRESK